jgi:hypothetical protein
VARAIAGSYEPLGRGRMNEIDQQIVSVVAIPPIVVAIKCLAISEHEIQCSRIVVSLVDDVVRVMCEDRS